MTFTYLESVSHLGQVDTGVKATATPRPSPPRTIIENGQGALCQGPLLQAWNYTLHNKSINKSLRYHSNIHILNTILLIHPATFSKPLMSSFILIYIYTTRPLKSNILIFTTRPIHNDTPNIGGYVIQGERRNVNIYNI